MSKWLTGAQNVQQRQSAEGLSDILSSMPETIFTITVLCVLSVMKQMDVASYQTHSLRRGEGTTQSRHPHLSTGSPRCHTKSKLHFLEFWPSAEGSELGLEKCQFQRFEYVRLVHLEMSHFGEKIEPMYNVFHVIREIVIDIFFSSHLDKTLIQFLNFHLRHKSALNFYNSQGLRGKKSNYTKTC